MGGIGGVEDVGGVGGIGEAGGPGGSGGVPESRFPGADCGAGTLSWGDAM
ncbi:hypothetical protein [Nitrosospira multiformis]|nr:hypothetical protein [Nitrosospira multiformis]